VFDAALLDAVQDGATQVVVLGAGFDSRAYRFQSQLGNVRVMEVDLGPTQAYKKQRLGEILDVIPSNVSFVPMDFTKDNLLGVRPSNCRDRHRAHAARSLDLFPVRAMATWEQAPVRREIEDLVTRRGDTA
jgi:methyltransferase (TIGR00027 family)